MKLLNIYDRDITRRINPAVVVSEMGNDVISQDIEEYVFTKDVTKNIYKFLDAVANKKEGKTGVWISGYYGSGKSHFIKYLFYCLNKKHREQAMENFKEAVKDMDPLEEPNLNLVTALHKKLEQLNIEEIIFNIDAVSDNRNAKDRITRVLINQLNAFRGFNKTNIALALYLEKTLDKTGNFQAFKDKIEEVGNAPWNDTNIPRYINSFLDKVIQTAKIFEPEIDETSLKNAIQDRNQDYTIEFLINELLDFLSDKDDNYRLLFLMDEVSQYIGSNKDLLLNLQTIVEEIGAKIGTRVWMVCTAQQKLQSLVDNTGNTTNEFGKIMGRFETMISLDSQDAAFITKKRVLDKSAEGIENLNNFYKTNQGAILNQFIFDHDLYKNFESKEDFIITYPFIPYQFRLISDVFESFSQVGYVGEGVKNTERAILGITHYTAQLCKDKEVGFFVPFDLFFNEQLEKNLMHNARGTLDRAYSIDDVKNDKFAKRVVNTLFMISNLGESQSVNFPANIENLALLLMDDINTPKTEKQQKIEKVLDVLVTKNIIQYSEGKYRFLKEDEIEVAALIKNTTVTNEDKFDIFFKDILQKLLNPNPTFQFGNKSFRLAISIDDKEIFSKGDINVKFVVFDTSNIDNMAHNCASNDLLIAISDWFNNDTDLKASVYDYIRTQKYISVNSSSATGTRFETLKNFRETNVLLLNDIKKRIELKFATTPIISKNIVVKANEISGANAPARYNEMLQHHFSKVFSKHYLSNGYATSSTDLIQASVSIQKSLKLELSPAEETLNNKLNFMGESPVVGDVVKEFEKPPYGWKDIATIQMLLKLASSGVKRFEWRNEQIDIKVFADKAINSRERDAITIHKEKVHSLDEIKELINTANDVFNQTMVSSSLTNFNDAVDDLKKSLVPIIKDVNKIKENYDGYPFTVHVKKYYSSLLEIGNNRNNESIASLLIEQKDNIKQQRDTFMLIDEFIKYNFESYREIKEFIQANKNNLSSLDEVLEQKGNDLAQYLFNDHEPWDKFPQMKKSFSDINKAIKDRIKELKEELTDIYTQLFKDIEEYKTKLGIDNPHITTDADFYLNKIRKEKQIAELTVLKLKAPALKSDNFKKVDDFKAREDAKVNGDEYVESLNVHLAEEMPPTTIETPEQLDNYIAKLRERLMVKLAKNKKIWLN